MVLPDVESALSRPSLLGYTGVTLHFSPGRRTLTVKPSGTSIRSVDLGPESSFTKFPSEVTLGNWLYYLVKGKKGYNLLSAVCPHAGGEVVSWGTTFMCPDHGWRFENEEGICINGPNARMDAFPVTPRGGHLFAEIPSEYAS